MGLVPTSVEAQLDTTRIISKRLDMVDVVQLGTGVDVIGGQNCHINPKLYIQYGSSHSFINVQGGMKLSFANLITSGDKDRLLSVSMPLYVAINFGALRWRFNQLYVGAEADYTIPLYARYSNPKQNITYSNVKALQSYPSVGGRIGLRISHCDMMFICMYDIRPAYNQKYIFESDAYDYYSLKTSIFERITFGISMSYIFPL